MSRRAQSVLEFRDIWRSSLKSGVLDGHSKRLIEPGRLTVPEFLRWNGYRTASIGKWHARISRLAIVARMCGVHLRSVGLHPESNQQIGKIVVTV